MGQLNDDCVIASLVGDKSDVNMEIIQVSGYSITLTTKYGQTFALGDIPKGCTILGVKQLVSKEYGVDPKHQILRHSESHEIYTDNFSVSSLLNRSFNLAIAYDIERAIKSKDDLFENPDDKDFIPLLGIAIGTHYNFKIKDYLCRPKIELSETSSRIKLRISESNKVGDGNEWLSIDVAQIESLSVAQNKSLFYLGELDIDCKDNDGKEYESEHQIIFIKTKEKLCPSTYPWLTDHYDPNNTVDIGKSFISIIANKTEMDRMIAFISDDTNSCCL